MATGHTGFPFPLKDLHHSTIKLIPFDPARHAGPYFEGTKDTPEIYQYMSIGPFSSEADFIERFIEKRIYDDPGAACFAIIDKRGGPSAVDAEGVFAGFITYGFASAVESRVNVGFGIILPQFHRTKCARIAGVLLYQYALDAPEDGGLGIGEVMQMVHPKNTASLGNMMGGGHTPKGTCTVRRVLPDPEKQQGSLQSGLMGNYPVELEFILWGMSQENWVQGGQREIYREFLHQMEVKGFRANL